MLAVVGSLLNITEMKDCESAMSYYTKKFEMTTDEFCDTLVDEFFETLSGNEKTKQQLHDFIMTMVRKDIKMGEHCNCTCTKGNGIH